MALRVALYAEGVGDAGGEWTLLPEPGVPLSDDHLGPAHVITRKTMVASGEGAGRNVEFVAPLRTFRGRHARGSDLVDRMTLRRLLSWPNPRLAPEIAVVLVDQDGDSNRRRKILEWTSDLPLTHVIAVPIPEFESWLLADEVSASRILARIIPTPPDPEGLDRGGAKALLASWLAAVAPSPGVASTDRGERELRRKVAEAIDLDRLKRLRSFEDFVTDCRSAVRQISRTN